MTKALFRHLPPLLLLSIPNQPVALVKAGSFLSCSSDEFACYDQSNCIPTKYLCDGDNDCKDQSDEQICQDGVHKDLFTCHDQSKCIPKEWVCLGGGGCTDYSHTSAAQCNDCAGDHLFKCQKSDKEVCLASKYKCDGIKHCSDSKDESFCSPPCLSRW